MKLKFLLFVILLGLVMSLGLLYADPYAPRAAPELSNLFGVGTFGITEGKDSDITLSTARRTFSTSDQIFTGSGIIYPTPMDVGLISTPYDCDAISRELLRQLFGIDPNDLVVRRNNCINYPVGS